MAIRRCLPAADRRARWRTSRFRSWIRSFAAGVMIASSRISNFAPAGTSRTSVSVITSLTDSSTIISRSSAGLLLTIYYSTSCVRWRFALPANVLARLRAPTIDERPHRYRSVHHVIDRQRPDDLSLPDMTQTRTHRAAALLAIGISAEKTRLDARL